MKPDDLMKCANLLGEVALNFANMPADKFSSVQAGLTCVMAQSYLVELAAHLSAGMEPFEAYEATVRGTLEVPASIATVLKILAAKPAQ